MLFRSIASNIKEGIFASINRRRKKQFAILNFRFAPYYLHLMFYIKLFNPKFHYSIEDGISISLDIVLVIEKTKKLFVTIDPNSNTIRGDQSQLHSGKDSAKNHW